MTYRSWFWKTSIEDVLPYFFTYKPISAISRDPESQGLSARLKLPPQKSKTIGYKPRAKLLIVTSHLIPLYLTFRAIESD